MSAPANHLIEVVTPRTNAATISSAENLLANIAPREPFALELAVAGGRVRLLARARSERMAEQLLDQLRVAYPQADLRPLPVTDAASADPGRRGPGERVAITILGLRTHEFLPIRTFRDVDVDAGRADQADPVLGIIGALAGLPRDWRATAQLLLLAAPDDWAKDYLRLAIEQPLAAEHAVERAAERGRGPSFAGVLLLAGLLGTAWLGWRAWGWYQTAQWLRLVALGGGVIAGLPAAYKLWRWMTDRPVYDPKLVAEKVHRPAYRAQLRVAVFAPRAVAQETVAARAAQLAASYRQYNLAAGNGFRTRPLEPQRRKGRGGHDGAPDGAPRSALAQPLATLAPLPGSRGSDLMTLSISEAAGLWHPPQALADMPFVERTGARQRLPLAGALDTGCRIGESRHQGRVEPVHLPEDLLGRNLLLVAKTRRGKSTLLLRIARHKMAGRGALVIVDPHRDLAWSALALVPPLARKRVVFLDLANPEHPFGFNLLDTGLGWTRDQAVENGLLIFKREFGQFWGPRMEDAFRNAMLALYEANAALCARTPAGGCARAEQYTILDIPALYLEDDFRKAILPDVSDPDVVRWWTGHFQKGLDNKLRMESINPVLTKINRVNGSWAARAIFGQARSTIDPQAWLRDRMTVIVNGSSGEVGEATTALIGGALVNLIKHAIAKQGALPAHQRRPVTLIVDEFHEMPGADYEQILSALNKQGANMVLATQGLTRLDTFDRDGTRALRATVFDNIDGLFAFHTSADNGLYLVPELGGESVVDVDDITALGEHQCYARISTDRRRLPVFHVQLDPPLEGDADWAAELAAQSAARWGRPRAAVEADRARSLARSAGFRAAREAQEASGGKGERPGEQPHPRNRGGAGGDDVRETRRGKRRRESPTPEPPQPRRSPGQDRWTPRPVRSETDHSVDDDRDADDAGRLMRRSPDHPASHGA